MASILYNSSLDDAARNLIDFDSDSFKIMLTSGYSPNRDTHTKRSDVTGEVSGTGYTTGGASTTTTVSKDLVNDRVTVTFSAPSWPSSSISATGAVIYKFTGSASTDPLVGFVDFFGTITSSGTTFSMAQSVLTFQNKND